MTCCDRLWPCLPPGLCSEDIFFLSGHVAVTCCDRLWPCLSPGLCSEDEERLVSDLFFGYNKLIRPVANMNRTVTVQFGLAFIQLIHVVSNGRVPYVQPER